MNLIEVNECFDILNGEFIKQKFETKINLYNKSIDLQVYNADVYVIFTYHEISGINLHIKKNALTTNHKGYEDIYAFYLYVLDNIIGDGIMAFDEDYYVSKSREFKINMIQNEL